MTAYQSPQFQFQAISDQTNLPLSFGLLYTYISGTNTPQSTFTDQTGLTPAANPVVLNVDGKANLYLGAGLNYRFDLWDATNMFHQTDYPVDNISASTPGGVTTASNSLALGGLPAASYVTLAELGNTTTIAQGQGLVGFNPALTYAAGTLPAAFASTASGQGDALVAIQRSLPGAIPSTVHAFNEGRVINVKTDFGAIGDGNSHPLSGVTLYGSTNTTSYTLAQWQVIFPFATALTNELDWCATMTAIASLGTAHGGTIYYPRGQYMMSGTVALPSTNPSANIAFIGEQSGGTYDEVQNSPSYRAHGPVRWTWTNNCGVGLELFPSSVVINYCMFEAICFDGNSLVSTVVHYAGTNYFRDCTIQRSATTNGIGLDIASSMDHGQFDNVNIVYHSLYGVRFLSAPVGHTICKFHNCRIAANGTANTASSNLYIENDSNALFDSCIFEDTYAYDVWFYVPAVSGGNTPGITNIRFENCWFEHATQYSTGTYNYMIYADMAAGAITQQLFEAQNVQFINCNFSGGAVGGTAQQYIYLNYSEDFLFDRCFFAGGDQGNGIVLNAGAMRTVFLDRMQAFEPVGSGPQGPITGGTDTVEATGFPVRWNTGIAYARGQRIRYQGIPGTPGSTYRCQVAHTSGVWATDLAAAKWVLVPIGGKLTTGHQSFESGIDGLPARAMLGSNNGPAWEQWWSAITTESMYVVKGDNSGDGLQLWNNAEQVAFQFYDSSRLGYSRYYTPASHTAGGVQGQTCMDASNFYFYTTQWYRMNFTTGVFSGTF